MAKILWLTWKDLKNPLAGGAEVVSGELAKRLVADGHEVVFLTANFENGEKEEIVDGYKIIRLGNKWTVYWKVYRYYKKNLQGWADVVIEEINTMPFFTQFYIKNTKRFLFFHQLCRKIWFYQIFFPLNVIGYIIEPVYLWVLRKNKAITVSQSTKKDLVKYGFKKDNIHIISEGINIDPFKDINTIQKFDKPTILSFGAVRKMKRTSHQLKAFEVAKKQIPDLQLKISGLVNDKYGEEFVKDVANNQYKKDIEFMGRVSNVKKEELMQRSHLICVTSVKEGWGLIVTEANSQGTPAVVYNADGLRDSVKHNKTGLVCNKNTPENLAENIVKLLKNKEKYEKLRQNAWKWSKEITFEKSYKDLCRILNII